MMCGLSCTDCLVIPRVIAKNVGTMACASSDVINYINEVIDISLLHIQLIQCYNYTHKFRFFKS